MSENGLIALAVVCVAYLLYELAGLFKGNWEDEDGN